jgi:parvulin-like peptidyl-prolyl isomerase
MLVAVAVAVAEVKAAAPTPMMPAPATTGAGEGDLFSKVIVAKGKGFEITRAQLDNEMIYARSSAVARGQNIAPEQMAMVEKQLLQQLIFLRALTTKASDADKTAGKDSADKQFNEMLSAVSTNTALQTALETRLKSVNLTQEQLHQQWTERAIADAVVRRELGIKVTDADVMAYYTNNAPQFEQPETVHAAHILLMTKDMDTGKDLTDAQKADKHKQLEDILKRARSGENFSNLVAQYSEDPGSKAAGGEYVFARGKMVPEFEAAAFSLRTNQISDIVTTTYGYHIIKLLEKMPASKIELAKVSTEVKDMLEQQAIIKQLPDYMKKIQKEANVEILEADLKPADIEVPGITTPPAP